MLGIQESSEPMSEETWVRSHDYCEVMIFGTDEVYAYADHLPVIPGVRWISGRNSLFRHADNPAVAAAFIREHFNGP